MGRRLYRLVEIGSPGSFEWKQDGRERPLAGAQCRGDFQTRGDFLPPAARFKKRGKLFNNFF